ncbi:MAG: hypothetical protein ACK41Y_16000 [Paracoccus hibiscisoli]
MFDIQTEAYLRRTTRRDDVRGASSPIPVTIAATLILWTAVLIAAL